MKRVWIRGDVVEIYFVGKCRMSNELPCTKMWCEGALTRLECNCSQSWFESQRLLIDTSRHLVGCLEGERFGETEPDQLLKISLWLVPYGLAGLEPDQSPFLMMLRLSLRAWPYLPSSDCSVIFNGSSTQSWASPSLSDLLAIQVQLPIKLPNFPLQTKTKRFTPFHFIAVAWQPAIIFHISRSFNNH